MDRRSSKTCLIGDTDKMSGNGGSSRAASDQESVLLDRIRLLEHQVASCVQGQSLLTRFVDKCNQLEQRMNSIQDKMEEQRQRRRRRRRFGGVHVEPEKNAEDANVHDLHDKVIPVPVSSEVNFEVQACSPQPPPCLYVCTLCEPSLISAEFENAKDLASHYTTHHPIPEGKKFTFIESEDMANKSEVQVAKKAGSSDSEKAGELSKAKRSQQTPCSTCHRVFSTSAHLERHIAEHHPVEWKCDLCDRKLSSKNALNDHKNALHFEAGFVTCSECGKRVFIRRLQTHMERHDRSRRRTCTICGKRFANVWSLRQHFRTHSNERPFACEHCGQKFKSSYNLTRHTLIHTRKSQVKDKWGLRTSTRDALALHISKKHVL